jgi:hypothetical protein
MRSHKRSQRDPFYSSSVVPTNSLFPPPEPLCIFTICHLTSLIGRAHILTGVARCGELLRSRQDFHQSAYRARGSWLEGVRVSLVHYPSLASHHVLVATAAAIRRIVICNGWLLFHGSLHSLIVGIIFGWKIAGRVLTCLIWL